MTSHTAIRNILFLSTFIMLSACGSGGNSASNQVIAPVAESLVATTSEDVAIDVLLNATDGNGGQYTYSIVMPPSSGSLNVVSGNRVTYTPSLNSNGIDSFVYKANDGSNDSNEATVSITVRPVNDLPVANPVVVTVEGDIAIEITLNGVDVDDDVLEYHIEEQPILGSLSPASGNKIIYTPDSNITGSDSFSYTVYDGMGYSTQSSVTITVVNSAPVAEEVAVLTNEDVTVNVELLANDVDEDALTYEIVDQPQYGQLSGIIGSSVSYTPMEDYFGEDSFSYKVNDGLIDSESAVVSLVIQNVMEATDLQGGLNDTGISLCFDYDLDNHSEFGGTFENRSELPCPVINFRNQDAQFGRDITNADSSDGHAGFSFTKLDANGTELIAGATEWSCVKDNVTGLVWEVKQGENLHNVDDVYYWYSTDSHTNGGYEGKEHNADNPDVCYGYEANNSASYCNTEAFVNRVNQMKLCGLTDWRLPSREAQRSIINYGKGADDNFLDSYFFPLLPAYFDTYNNYWSSSTLASDKFSVWVAFSAGSHGEFLDRTNFKYTLGPALLVSGEY